jgi:hypothetical protein
MPDRRPNPLPDLLACGLLAVGLALLIWNRVAYDVWVARHDNLTAYLPWWSYLGERLSAGEIPGWNPYQFSGIPFLTDPQSGWMYAPTMLSFTFFEPITAMKVKAAIELVIAGYGAYALARVLGYRPLAAFTGAAVFAFGPLTLFTTYCCTVRLHIAVWIPLALLGAEMALRLGTQRTRLIGIGLGGFAYSQMLAGWLGQGSFDAAMIIGAFCLYRALTLSAAAPLRRIATGVATGLAIGLFAAALDAAALFPRIATNSETFLGAGNYDRLTKGYSYAPFGLKNLVATLINDDFRHRGFTVPAAALLLALLALTLAPRAHPVPFFAGMTLVLYMLTLDWGPLYWLLSLLPKWEELHDHYPQQVASAVMIGPAMLAAASVEALPGLYRLRFRLLRIALPPLVLAAGVAWIAAIQGNNRPLLIPVIVLAVMVLLIGLVATGPFNPAGVNAVALVIGLLIFLEPTGLELIDAGYDGRIIQGWYEFWDPDPDLADAAESATARRDPGGAGDFLQRQVAAGEPFRYAGYGGHGFPGDRSLTYQERRAEPDIEAILVNGRSIFLGLYDMQGYNPTQLARYVEYVTAMNGSQSDYHLAELRVGGIGTPLLDMLNVRYVLIDNRLPADRDDVAALTRGEAPLFANELVSIYENPNAFPHAWIVHDLRHLTRPQATAVLTERAVDFRTVALVEGNGPALAEPAPGTTDRAEVTRYEPERVEIDVTAAADGLLVVSDLYAKGWRAAVDGESTTILPTNLALRGVPVPAGQHTVTLTYRPPWLGAGLVVSAAAHVALAGLLVFGLWSFVVRARLGEQHRVTRVQKRETKDGP